MLPVEPYIQMAYETAKQVRLNAYAPYSNFLVGAALLLEGSEEPVAGCNVENASFGATICAERNAILHWVARTQRSKEIRALVLVTSSKAAVPCGLCLQVLSEFCDGELAIYIGDLEGIQSKKKLGDFLPSPFCNSNLPKV